MPRHAQIAVLALLAALMAALGASPTRAQEPSADIIAASPEGSEGWEYLRGLKHGMEWLLASKDMARQVVPYCVPPELPVTTGQFRQILQAQLQREPTDGSKPAGLVLLKGLRRSFPCPAK